MLSAIVSYVVHFKSKPHEFEGTSTRSGKGTSTWKSRSRRYRYWEIFFAVAIIIWAAKAVHYCVLTLTILNIIALQNPQWKKLWRKLYSTCVSEMAGDVTDRFTIIMMTVKARYDSNSVNECTVISPALVTEAQTTKRWHLVVRKRKLHRYS